MKKIICQIDQNRINETRHDKIPMEYAKILEINLCIIITATTVTSGEKHSDLLIKDNPLYF